MMAERTKIIYNLKSIFSVLIFVSFNIFMVDVLFVIFYVLIIADITQLIRAMAILGFTPFWFYAFFKIKLYLVRTLKWHKSKKNP